MPVAKHEQSVTVVHKVPAHVEVKPVTTGAMGMVRIGTGHIQPNYPETASPATGVATPDGAVYSYMRVQHSVCLGSAEVHLGTEQISAIQAQTSDQCLSLCDKNMNCCGIAWQRLPVSGAHGCVVTTNCSQCHSSPIFDFYFKQRSALSASALSEAEETQQMVQTRKSASSQAGGSATIPDVGEIANSQSHIEHW
jgi:hypothetical protein